MKSNKIILISFLSLLITLSVYFLSCEIKSPTEGIEVRVKNIARTTTVRVEFIDSKTGKMIGTDASANINVKFEGQNKNDIISEVNEPLAELTTSNGTVYFAIKDNINPSPQNPVEVILVCKSEKYLTTSGRVFIAAPGTHAFSIIMVNLQENAQGEGIETNEVNDGNTNPTGGTDKEIVVSTTEDSSDPDVTVTIPPGTILKDENGKALSGDIKTRVTYFNPTSEEATSSFPGGLSVNVNTQGRGEFITAGFAAIDMSVNGTDVSNFGGAGIDVQFTIPSGFINPETGNPVQPGDKIPIWSYNEENGEWKYEGDYTVKSNLNKSNLVVPVKNVKHLSWWNLDYFSSGSCLESNKRVFIDGCVFPVYVRMFYADNPTQCLKQSTVFSYDPYIDLMFYNSNKSYLFKAYSNSSYTDLIGTTTIQFDCYNGGTKEIVNWPISSASNLVPVNVYVRGICPNGNVLDQGTLDVELYKDNRWQIAGRIVDGYIKLCLALNQEYNFRVYYDGEYFEQKHTAHSSEEHVDITLGSDIDLCK